MKREIKFRVWDNKKNNWHTDQVLIDEEGMAYILATGVECDYLSRQDVEICFYTGLKDKNGKEIYEGDIIDYGHNRFKEVIFDNGKYCMKSLEGMVWLLPMYTVIGNIYEHPELIKSPETIIP